MYSLTIDEKINAALTPFVSFFADVVFTTITIANVEMPILVIWLTMGMLFFTFYFNFINFRGFTQALRIVRGDYDNPNDPGEVTHFQALSTALSNTVGLGNIAGVAVAISIGGPGATFWMILAGLFGMATKFTEVTLGHKYRVIHEDGTISGGPMYYMSQGLANLGWPNFGKALAFMAAISAIVGGFGSGAMFQTNQSTQQLSSTIETLSGQNIDGSQWVLGLIIAALVGFVIIGGLKRIVHVTQVLVPVMAIFYMTSALVIIAFNYQAVPQAFVAIFEGAFAPIGVAGGFIGVFIQGIKRATFSNEAGLGYAAIAHAPAKTTEPVAEGLVALLEPFIDTVLVCTATALVIIITGAYLNPDNLNGIALTSAAFGSVVSWFPHLLSVAAVLFAFSTIIASFYFSQRAFIYLVKKTSFATDLTFKLLFLTAIILGSGMDLSVAIDFADASYMAIAFPNLLTLYILAPEVKLMLSNYMERLKNGEIKPYIKTQKDL
jgi:AGCS family alanine or glycine:cation symporter